MCKLTIIGLGWTKVQQIKYRMGQGLAATGAFSSLCRHVHHLFGEYRINPLMRLNTQPNLSLCEHPGSPTGFPGPLAQGGGFFLGFIHCFPGHPIPSAVGLEPKLSPPYAFFYSSQLVQHIEKETHWKEGSYLNVPHKKESGVFLVLVLCLHLWLSHSQLALVSSDHPSHGGSWPFLLSNYKQAKKNLTGVYI